VSGPFTVACVQTNTGSDLAANLKAATGLVHEAHRRGADLITLPEVVGLIEPDHAVLLAQSPGEDNHKVLAAFVDLAAGLKTWLLVGSIAVDVGEGRLANRSILLDQSGRLVARYDKIHLFDVDLPNGEHFRESYRYRAGTEACLAELPWGVLGMAVCYDLRFPQLTWDLARAGAAFLCVPSAFTARTGRDHWEVLLRARAIETGCYVIAPAQCGTHAGGRQSHGHSLVVDPWGLVLADGGEAPGVVTAKINPARVVEARAALPTLTNARAYAIPSSRRAAE